MPATGVDERGELGRGAALGRDGCGTLLGRPSADGLDRTAGVPDTGVADRGGALGRTCATPPAGLIERGYVLGRTGTSLRPVAVPAGGLRILDDGGGGGVDGTPPVGDSDRGGMPGRDARPAVTACIPTAGVSRRVGGIVGVVTATSATNTGPGPSSSSLPLPQSESMSSVGGMID